MEPVLGFLQCFDTVGWLTEGAASGLWKSCSTHPQPFSTGTSRRTKM